jgi:hypothetical protein
LKGNVPFRSLASINGSFSVTVTGSRMIWPKAMPQVVGEQAGVNDNASQ